MACTRVRRERVHHHGISNRPKDLALSDGPLDFDSSMRSTLPRTMKYDLATQVPVTTQGMGNRDFHPKLAGHDYRQPNANPKETQRLKQDGKAKEAFETMSASSLNRTAPPTVVALNRDGSRVDEAEREAKQRGHKKAPRWNPKRWYEAPAYEQAPLQKDEGATWNHMESHQVQGDFKGQDRLMRSVRRPEDVATPQSDAGGRHPLQFDHEEYYPGRGLIDASDDGPTNDFQVRPTYLPDFAHPPPEGVDSVRRMQRLRQVIKERYAGRPTLMKIFKSCATQKPGFVFPRGMQEIFDRMGIKVSENEAQMLVDCVDKDGKGALSFEEFSDLIFGNRVNVGGAAQEAHERHVRHVTKRLVDTLVTNGQALRGAFCDLDPERQYLVSKPQFAHALGTACNHISRQAVEFLWASQFPGHEGQDYDDKCLDWRSFMSQLAHFSHDHREPTPIFVQGRKRNYDLLHRTVALTGGVVPDLDLNRPDQDASDEVHIVGDKLVHHESSMSHKPRDAALLTESYVEVLRNKADRAVRALPQRLPKARLKELLSKREMVHQDELIDLICDELGQPHVQDPLHPQEPLYASAMQGARTKVGKADVMTLDPESLGPAAAEALAADPGGGGDATSAERLHRPHADGSLGGFDGPTYLKLKRAEIEAFVAIQRTNRDHEIKVSDLIENIYRDPEEVRMIEKVNDGLNRNLRGHRPPRERPAHSEEPRHENYWQARYLMEALADAMTAVETANAGKLKPSKVFKRIDSDGDGYITLSDLRIACDRYKVPHSSADLHAAFSELDPPDHGSVDVGEFCRNFELRGGSLLENMQKPIRAVYHEGGVDIGGPVQEEIDRRHEELAQKEQAAGESPTSAAPGNRATSAPPSAGGGSTRSQMSRAGASIAQPLIYESQALQFTGKGRVSDVIRARHSMWKADKSELYTSLPKTRFGMTMFPDTRHVTEANMPLSGSFMHDAERFKTTNGVHSVFAVPDPRQPHAEDTMRKHARNEFRVERIRQRQRDFDERCWAANEASREFDELKVARKAMNLLNYERRCHMSCA